MAIHVEGHTPAQFDFACFATCNLCYIIIDMLNEEGELQLLGNKRANEANIGLPATELATLI